MAFGLKTPIIKPGDDIVKIIINAIENYSLEIMDGDVIIIAETPLATAQNRLIKIKDIEPTPKALKIADKYQMDARIVQIILQEADSILGGVKGLLLTEKDGFLHANAGIDQSNAPPGTVVLLPENPQKTVDDIRKRLQEYFNKKLAVIIADSRTQPLKRGVIGGAIAVSGMEPVEDCRNKPDIYGYKLKYTFRAIADDLTSIAQLLFGETNQQIPIVVIKGAKIKLTDKISQLMYISKEECLFMNILCSKNEI